MDEITVGWIVRMVGWMDEVIKGGLSGWMGEVTEEGLSAWLGGWLK